MGRNRRFGSPEDSPDVPAIVKAARASLAVVRKRAPELWEHLYAPDVEHPAQYDAEGREQPQQTRVRAQRMGHANWTHAARVQRTYVDVVAELARAHWELGSNTDVPDYWTHAAEVPALTGERAHTVELPELLKWAKVLDDSLAWLVDQELLAPEVNALMRAAEHVKAARKHIEHLWPRNAAKELAERDCANKVNGCTNAARSRGTECQVCVNYRSKHDGKPRIVNDKGRAA